MDYKIKQIQQTQDNSHILQESDIIELTGTKIANRQKQILAAHGIKFITRTDGKIRTTWEAISAALAPKTENYEEHPDLEFLRQ